jgi:Tfp pilus assembly protein PilN
MELAKIAKEAKPLEEIEKKFKALENKNQKKSSSLDFLHELYQVMPEQISLTNLNYEEDGKVILRGQAAELNSVFTFVSQLEKSQILKDFNIKMRYATQKRTQAGEVVSFEIICAKR